MEENKTLRELILEDFGIDLPLLGGHGTREMPYAIAAKDAQEATDIEAQLMRCLARGQNRAWRWLGQELLEDAIGVDILRVRFRAHEVVDERVRYYFNWQLEERRELTAPLPAPCGFLDPRSRIWFPYELGWVHLSGVTDNERDSPGLGVSVTYGGFQTKATLYAYDLGMPVDSSDSSQVETEFRRAVGDALSISESAKVSQVGQLSDQNGRRGHYLAILEMPDEMVSAVLLGVLGRHFVKARVTWSRADERVYQMGHECVRVILEQVVEARD